MKEESFGNPISLRRIPHKVREELKLNRPDVGWYQVRKSLEARNKDGASIPVSFEPFKQAYEALGDKLQPMVFELGFMQVNFNFKVTSNPVAYLFMQFFIKNKGSK